MEQVKNKNQAGTYIIFICIIIALATIVLIKNPPIFLINMFISNLSKMEINYPGNKILISDEREIAIIVNHMVPATEGTIGISDKAFIAYNSFGFSCSFFAEVNNDTLILTTKYPLRYEASFLIHKDDALPGNLLTIFSLSDFRRN